MLTSNTYCALSQSNKKIIKEIKNKGHHISLHFDPTCYSNINNDLAKKNYLKIY